MKDIVSWPLLLNIVVNIQMGVTDTILYS